MNKVIPIVPAKSLDLNLNVFGSLCETAEFTVNGVSADYLDFGSKSDNDPDNAEPWGCGNMRFTLKLATSEILDKYKISVDDYNTIAENLREELSFGHCALCS